MPLNRYVVRVDPQGQSVTVDILDTSGVSVIVYDSPQFAAAPRTLPMVITAQTDFWLRAPGPYDVSCKVGGAEVADAGAPKRVQVSDVPVLVVPDWERERTASSGGSTPPSSMTLNGGGGAYGATYASVTFSDNSDPAPVGTDIVWDGVDTVTIATAGTYAVSWYADGGTTAGGSAEVWAKVSRNNDALGPFYYHETHKVIPASSDFDIDGSVTTPLAANDTLKLMVRATSGGANGPANGALTVTRVG